MLSPDVSRCKFDVIGPQFKPAFHVSMASSHDTTMTLHYYFCKPTLNRSMVLMGFLWFPKENLQGNADTVFLQAILSPIHQHKTQDTEKFSYEVLTSEAS